MQEFKYLENVDDDKMSWKQNPDLIKKKWRLAAIHRGAFLRLFDPNI